MIKKLIILIFSIFVLTNNAKSIDVDFDDITIYLNASGVAVIDNSFINNGSSDNSSIYSISIDKNKFDYESIGENWVTMTVTDINGNIDSFISIVTVLDTIKPVVNSQDITVYLNASGIAEIDKSSINNGSSDNTSIYSISIDKDRFDYESIGENWVTMTVTDVYGNVDYSTSIVTVIDDLERGIQTNSYVPNAFTPNNDGINDVFVPVIPVHSTGNYEFTVYSIRGEMIFRTNSSSEGWNGSFDGVEVPNGDYLWTLIANSKVGINVQSQKGYVKLIR